MSSNFHLCFHPFRLTFTPRNVCMLHPHVGEVRSFIARLRAGWGGNMAHGVGQQINGWNPKMEVPFQPLWLLGEPAVNFQGCNQARAFPNKHNPWSFGGWILMICKFKYYLSSTNFMSVGFDSPCVFSDRNFRTWIMKVLWWYHEIWCMDVAMSSFCPQVNPCDVTPKSC